MGWRRGQAYSQDLRDRVLAAEGTAEVVSTRFGVSRSYVIKARQRRDRLGDASAGPQWSHTPAKLAGHDAALCARVQSVRKRPASAVLWASCDVGGYVDFVR